MLLFGSISIIYKRLKDANNKNQDLEAKIYHITLKTILQHTYLSFFFIDFEKMRC